MAFKGEYKYSIILKRKNYVEILSKNVFLFWKLTLTAEHFIVADFTTV